MKKAVLNFLLSRGVSALQQALSKVVRHGITAAGGGALVGGLITSADMLVLQGAGTILVSVLISMTRIFLTSETPSAGGTE